MRSPRTGWIAAALVAAACATGGGAKAPAVGRVKQADYKPPREAEIDNEGERSKFRDANVHMQRGVQAADSGNDDQSRGEHRAAGEGFAALAEQHRGSDWRIVYRMLAADNYRRAQLFEQAARQAEAMRQDPGASEATKAIGARLAAGMWQTFGNQEAKAGRLEPLRIVPASARKGQKPSPKPLEGPWQRLVENADVYVAVHAADADPKATDYAGALAYFAAVAHFSRDNVEEAQKRLAALIEKFPTAEQADDAVALYLQTYAVLGDQAGYRDALGRVSARVDELLAQAKGQGNKERADRLEKLRGQIGQDQRSQGYVEATNLLNAGKPGEAAAAFEAYAKENAQAADAPNALYNAAVAHDRAEQPKRAAAARERLLAGYPESKLAGPATLALASSRSRGGDHAEAAELYAKYLAKWPEGENRCLALQNRGAETFQAGKKAEAAKLLADFGKDPACAKGDPNAAARALYTAGAAAFEAKNKAGAKDAWTALTRLQGVTDTVAKSQVADARERLKGLR